MHYIFIFVLVLSVSLSFVASLNDDLPANTIQNIKKRNTPIGPSVNVSTNNDLTLKKPTNQSIAVTTATSLTSQKVTTEQSVTKKNPLNTEITNGPKLLGVNGTGQQKTISNHSVLLVGPYLDDNISISKFIETDLNKTLRQHNITDNSTKYDNHVYYNSTFSTNKATAERFWIDLDKYGNDTIHQLLSSAHRRAATVTLSFDFPFYGHFIRNVTLATGGFLYTGEHVHAWLAATQYIAPLMANFDTSLSNESLVRYMDNGTAFTVAWEKVVLRDKSTDGHFTFQVTLHKNGDIVFVYHDIPLIVEDIKDDLHPVKIGLSDAYIIDSSIFLLRRKTIYEYHRVNFRKEDIKNNTVIYLKALPTCLDYTDCESCTNTKNNTSMQCVWCPALQKCSSGVDRHRQAWILKGCNKIQVKNATQCFHDTTSYKKTFADQLSGRVSYEHDPQLHTPDRLNDSPKNIPQVKESRHETNNVSESGTLSIVFIAVLLVSLAFWSVYAYRNPHTTSGQILIKYRPSQWRWKRGEARYTAATIHM